MRRCSSIRRLEYRWLQMLDTHGGLRSGTPGSGSSSDCHRNTTTSTTSVQAWGSLPKWPQLKWTYWWKSGNSEDLCWDRYLRTSFPICEAEGWPPSTLFWGSQDTIIQSVCCLSNKHVQTAETLEYIARTTPILMLHFDNAPRQSWQEAVSSLTEKSVQPWLWLCRRWRWRCVFWYVLMVISDLDMWWALRWGWRQWWLVMVTDDSHSDSHSWWSNDADWCCFLVQGPGAWDKLCFPTVSLQCSEVNWMSLYSSSDSFFLDLSTSGSVFSVWPLSLHLIIAHP